MITSHGACNKAVNILKSDYEAQLHSLRRELETLRQQTGGGGATKSANEADTSEEEAKEDEDGRLSMNSRKCVKSVSCQERHEVCKALKSVCSDGGTMAGGSSMKSMTVKSLGSELSMKSVSFARGCENTDEGSEPTEDAGSGSSASITEDELSEGLAHDSDVRPADDEVRA